MPYEAEPIDEIDPVCEMEVDPGQAHILGLETEHGGIRYVFCSKACRAAFIAEPSRYASVEGRPAL